MPATVKQVRGEVLLTYGDAKSDEEGGAIEVRRDLVAISGGKAFSYTRKDQSKEYNVNETRKWEDEALVLSSR